MSSINISQLSPDVQGLICSRLWNVSPKSVRALSVVNQSFFNATKPYLYRYLSLSVYTPENLNKVVKHIQGSNTGRNYLRHTRHLEVWGRMKISDAPSDLQAFPPIPRPGSRFNLEEGLHPRFEETFYSDGHFNTPEDDVKAWEPLVLLLAEFQNLKNLIYQCRGRFAPGLLAAIHQYHPACKLHLRLFRFKSLHEDFTSPDELALATSPCLHSLSIPYVWRDANGVDDHNAAAALSTVSLAPNLKHLRMLGCSPATSNRLYNSLGKPTESWRGFAPAPEASKIASLESLSFCLSNRFMDKSKLETWSKHMDFSRLRQFSFEIYDAAVLSDFTTCNQLSDLKELTIGLRPDSTDEHFGVMTESFFRKINPLSILSVSGALHEELLTSICHRHGSTLKALVIRPQPHNSGMQIGESHIRLIGDSCPRLSDIDLVIKRTRGDERETRCYEALRNIENLESARIHLDCSNPRNPPSTGMGSDYTDLKLETALVNSAVDESLVTSIWDAICGGLHESPFARLTITSGGGSSRPGDLMSIVQQLSRSYKITKTDRGDHSELVVVELSKEKREKADKERREDDQIMMETDAQRGSFYLGIHAYQAFNRLWPFDEEKGNWREVWKSLPLHRTM